MEAGNRLVLEIFGGSSRHRAQGRSSSLASGSSTASFFSTSSDDMTAEEAKKQRTNKKRTFTRELGYVEALLKAETQDAIELKEQFEKAEIAHRELVLAHELVCNFLPDEDAEGGKAQHDDAEK